MRKVPNTRWMRQHMIASTSDGEEMFGSGLQAVIDGKDAGIIHYACDSYYGIELGTDVKWDDDKGYLPEYDWLWEGTAEELIHAAKTCTDLMFPTRQLNPEDSDYDEMMKLYTAIRTYLRKEERRKRKRGKYQQPKVSKVFDRE